MLHSRRALLLPLITLLAAASLPAALVTSGQSFFAQFADGAGWKSRMILQNQGVRAVPFRVEFRDSAGRRLDVSLNGGARNWFYEGSIAAKGTIFLDSSGTGTTLNAGYVRLSSPTCATTDTGAGCNPGIPLVTGTLIFQQTATGRPTYEASVPLNSSGGSLGMPVDNSSGYTTALAILNPTTAPVRVRAALVDESGQAVAERTVELAGRERVTYVLRDLISQAAGARGTLQITGVNNAQVVALGLLFRDDGPFSTLLVSDYFNE